MALRTLIEAPETQPGHKLPSEAELARGFGVGRSTVREALQVLSHLGLVEPRNGLGTYVRSKYVQKVDANEESHGVGLGTIFEFRQCIEVAAARLAAMRRSESEGREIAALWEAARDVARAENVQAFVDADFAFHRRIVQASRNTMLINAYDRESANIIKFISSMLKLGPPSILTNVHDDLVRAIIEGDGDAASLVAEESFREVYFRLQFVN